MRTVILKNEYITLGQLLKHLDIISNGAEAKDFLNEYDCWINGEPDNRRGRKIRNGDTVKFPNGLEVKIEDPK